MSIRVPEVVAEILKSLAMPWVLRQIGLGKYLRTRLLHVPEAVLGDVAGIAGVTPKQWRAVEAAQADLAEGKINSVIG